MVTTYYGLVCTSARQEHFGYVIFRNRGPSPVEFVCSQWGWPPTDEGRDAARQRMVRVIERLQLEDIRPAMRALGAQWN